MTIHLNNKVPCDKIGRSSQVQNKMQAEAKLDKASFQIAKPKKFHQVLEEYTPPSEENNKTFNYRLNIQQQNNGEHELHKQGCRFYPLLNFENIGMFDNCELALLKAKRTHPYKIVNACPHCAFLCYSR